MAGIGGKWGVVLRPVLTVVWSFLLASIFVSAERSLKTENSASAHGATGHSDLTTFSKLLNFLWQADESGYQHVWPVSFKNCRPFFLKKIKNAQFSYFCSPFCMN